MNITGILTSIILATAMAVPAMAQEATKKWDSSAAIGATVTKGNSDTLLFSTGIQGTRKWDKNVWQLGADGAYGENQSVKNTEVFHAFTQFNRLFSDMVFGYLRADGLHDSIADVEYRFTLSPGAGYYFIKNDRMTLSGEVGPGFISEKVGSTTKNYLSLRVAERFDYKINDRAKLWQSAEWLPQVDNLNNYIINAEIGVDTKITTNLSLRVTLNDTYDNEPAPGRKKNDLKLIAGVAYSF
ncbi:MAG: DUF481 domain-containing protein [Verrucomicrobia bacterium]|nr:DUF481 domain-containing protein [Verrucomicrobiota bacterium]